MKSPISTFDAKSGLLCSKCESKLESGGMTRDDVEAAIRLARLADRSLLCPDVIALRGDLHLADKIEGDFGQKVWSVKSEASDRRFVEGLLCPLRVLSANLFWLPDGNKLTKAIVAGDGKRPRSIQKRFKRSPRQLGTLNCSLNSRTGR